MADPDTWSLDDLRAHLQGAVELELLVIPPYLCALYSLYGTANREAALIIRSVVVEEMLHMTLAANILNAVGGTPEIGRGKWAPRYPARIPYHQGEFELGLRPFGDEALDAFLTVENPSYRPASLPSPSANAFAPRLTTLGDYRTVGEFYKAIAAGLESLVHRLGEERVFSGREPLQVGAEHYYASGGKVIKIHRLEDALRAIAEVVEQGEGEVTIPPEGEKFDPDRDLAHFYRFKELRAGRRYLADDLPADPTGPPLELDPKSVYPMKPNLRVTDIPSPELRRAAEDCNRIWSRLLGQIEAALTGTPEVFREAVDSMFELKYAAVALLRVPLGEDGFHAGPTFELDATG